MDTMVNFTQKTQTLLGRTGGDLEYAFWDCKYAIR